MTWQSVPLAEVCNINPKLGRRLGDDELVSFLGMADVSERGFTMSGTDRPFAEVRKGYTSFEDGDVLLAKITPCFQNAKIAQARLAHHQGFGSTEFHVLRGTERLDQRYLLHFLRRDRVLTEGERRMTGSGGQRRVPVQFLEVLQIPLPPLPEQRRIAAILDHADTLREKRRAAEISVEALRQSVFDLVLGNLRQFPTCQLQELAAVRSGLTKGRRVAQDAKTRVVPYMAVLNVQDRRLDLSQVKEIEATEPEIQKYLLREGDLLLTEGGDPDKLGRGTVWRTELPESIHQNHIFNVRLHSDLISPVVLNWITSGRYGKQYFLRSAKQTTGIASINAAQLKAFPVPLVPVTLQSVFLDNLAKIDRIADAAAGSRNQLEALFSSLQSRAFRGQL